MGEGGPSNAEIEGPGQIMAFSECAALKTNTVYSGSTIVLVVVIEDASECIDQYAFGVPFSWLLRENQKTACGSQVHCNQNREANCQQRSCEGWSTNLDLRGKSGRWEAAPPPDSIIQQLHGNWNCNKLGAAAQPAAESSTTCSFLSPIPPLQWLGGATENVSSNRAFQN